MNAELVLSTMNKHGVRYLLIGGMNFMLRHQPILTYDVDLWIDDTEENRRRCEAALAALNAEWGATDDTWGPVAKKKTGWLDTQSVFCTTSPHIPVDIFRSVVGLEDWHTCWQRALQASTTAGTPYRGLSDEDMLRCQLSLSPGEQKQERIRLLQEALQRKGETNG